MFSYIYIVLFFWFLHILRRSFFWVYFCQLKEYNFGRIFEELSRNFSIFLPNVSIVAFVFFILSPIFLQYQITSVLFNIVLSIFYFVLGSWAIFLIYQKKWKIPEFSPKAILFLCLVILFNIGIVYFLIDKSVNIFVYLTLLEFLFPLVIFIFDFILEIPTFIITEYLATKAAKKRDQFKDLISIGITGSYGKTSTKDFLATILSEKFNVLKTERSINKRIGIAKTILQNLNENYDIFVCEVAAELKKGTIKKSAKVFKPQIGVLTGISQQHIRFFKDLDQLSQVKYELIEALPEDGMAFFNGSNDICQKLAKRTTKPKIIYSLNKTENSDIWAENINQTQDSVSFEVKRKKGRGFKIEAPILGKNQVENLLGAIAVSLSLGMTIPEIRNGAGKVQNPFSSLKKRENKKGVFIIEDLFSENPNGVLAALDYLKIFNGKKIIIMPCLIELGKASDSIHETIGRKIGKVCDFAIITTPFYFSALKRGAIAEGMNEKNILQFSDPQKIKQIISPYLKRGNIILLEGRLPLSIINLFD
ncbi:MAG: Mur ligase family protein [Candidatus Pacebacteria bacterium]|nr:Mur ligase family protein [Candidatus Paceibacterota bacterium]